VEAPNRTVGDDLSPLWVPVPRNLAEVLGYVGGARYVAYYWNNAVDELAYDDGRRRGVGESLQFVRCA
jgi:hypothetical protein